jgi:hypothetical protein
MYVVGRGATMTYHRGTKINNIADMTAYLLAGAFFYHASHILPAGQIKTWTWTKIQTKIKAGQMFLAERET